MKIIAGSVARSFLFAHARHLLEHNKRDWNYPLTKWQKVLVGAYMILSDYSAGLFPPKFEGEKTTFDAELTYYDTLQGLGKTQEELALVGRQKPFWYGPGCTKFLDEYVQVQSSMYKNGLRPPATLLEVGCGSGWMAEFLAASGFSVLATTLNEAEAHTIELRKRSLEIKGLPAQLGFRQSPMEYVHDHVRDLSPFDVVYVYEALHHAYDWRKAIKSFYDSLAPNGWCYILNEPNVMHTFISYRVGRLSNSHEIGLSVPAIRRTMKQVGFTKVRILKNRVHWWTKPIWIAAQKGSDGPG
jgi:2-polyprenyl-3-methyl-5-hydroxy-6-metoxy-1,4-benzoquinol methylase